MKDYATDIKPTWCMSCGNFGIKTALTRVFDELKLPPHQVLMFTDVGCGGNQSSWYKTYTFHSLHGRSLPPAIGAKMVNPGLNVIVQCGDGGAYGEGTNHLIHAARRNIDLIYMVHNNQRYSLTTGQATPTTDQGSKTKSTPEGTLEPPLNPLALAIASGATFVARAFSNDVLHLMEIIKSALDHKGFAIIDILQPCVVLNKDNTAAWFKERIYKLENHDVKNKVEAFKRAQEWNHDKDAKIPIGIFYQEQRPTLNQNKNLTQENIENIDVSKLLEEFN